LLIAVGAALALAPAVAGAAGGPSPGVVVGLNGVVARDGSVRYIALPAGPRTVVGAIRLRGGHVARFATLRGSYGIPMVAFDGKTHGLSFDGRTLVLAGVNADPGRQSSRFAVLDIRRMRARQTFGLRGAFSFDALSPSGKTLFLVEHLGGRQDPSRYRVRAYDLGAGRLLRSPIADKRLGTSVMRGFPAARATSRDTRWAYTLYQGDHPFVHALDTVRRTAVCIDLPHGASTAGRLSLEGSRLLVLDRQNGRLLATIDARTLRLV
jgi:hypothetical protein